MTENERQIEVDHLCLLLAEKIQQYSECMTKDEILSVRKELRIEIKEIQKQIADLREPEDGQLC